MDLICKESGWGACVSALTREYGFSFPLITMWFLSGSSTPLAQEPAPHQVSYSSFYVFLSLNIGWHL